MKTIYKYQIHPDSVVHWHCPINIVAPKDARPVFVGVQNGITYLWCEVELDNPIINQEVLLCIGTGHGKVPEGCIYFGSVVVEGYVWHFYRKFQLQEQ